MSETPRSLGNTYHHIHISDNARVLLGNSVGQAADRTPAARADYVGQYSKSSLRPVVNYVPRPGLHEKIKRQLHDLEGDEVHDRRVLVVVWGLGGAGKSQLVLNYIREYPEDYSAVFWIEAGSKESIERDYIQMYRLLYDRQIGVGQEMLKVEDAVPAVKNWFHGKEGRWLIVLDSADTIDDDQARSYIDLEYFMPDAPGVHIIITSRSSTAQEMTGLEAVEVAEMVPAEAAELFQRCAKLKEKRQEVELEVGQIVKELGCLALAVTLAGSYVSVTPRLSSDIRGYLPEYRQRRKELLRQRPKQHIHRYGESVLSTWEASFDAIASQSPAAARLLSVLAFMNFDDIFLALFDSDTDLATQQQDISPLPVQWQLFLFPNTEWNLYELESAFATLQTYSLIQWRSDQESYTMHKLVHAWGQDRLDRESQWRSCCVAHDVLAGATAGDQLNPGQKLRLLPHLMANFGTFLEKGHSKYEVTRDRLAVVAKIAGFVHAIGRYSEAYEMQMFDSRKTEEMLGMEHPDTLSSMNNLAVVLSNQGKYDEAEKLYRQTLALNESVLGKNHPDTLTNMNNFGLILYHQGKYEKAENLYRQTLALNESVLGEKHPRTLDNMNNLAGVLTSQGKYDEAEKLHRQTLALNESVSGKKHPNTLTNMNNLAGVLTNEGKYDEAEKLYRQALALNESALGKKHPNTLATMNNLALVLNHQGKHEKAESLHGQTLMMQESVLGKKHPDTLLSMNNLAGVLTNQGKYDEAEKLYRQTLMMQESVLGKNLPDTLTNMSNLATVSNRQGKHHEAEELHRETLMLRESVLGKKHADTLTSMNNLVVVLKSQSKYEEAEKISREILALKN